MIASLARTMQGRRSGNGRECNLKAQQRSITAKPDNSSVTSPNQHQEQQHQQKHINAGRKVGEISQALAWEKNAKALFTKSPSKTSTTSVSTSPDTEAFPFFKEESDDDEDRMRELSSLQTRRSGRLSQSQAGGQGQGPTAAVVEAARKLDYQNPLFHMPLQSDARKEADQSIATASFFPRTETPVTAMNASNPMFSMANRNEDGSSAPKARPEKKVEEKAKMTDNESKKASSKHRSSETPEERAARRERKKKERVAYEHVGRMDVRATIVEVAHDKDKGAAPKNSEGSKMPTPRSTTSKSSSSSKVSGNDDQVAHRGFRVDSFARNEGNDREVAHFKFVFTFETVDGASVDHNRPVLDVVHERETGKLRVRVNDGRLVETTRSAVEINLNDVGAVLFNPKVQAKGHHLYTLQLGSNTLFSVLA